MAEIYIRRGGAPKGGAPWKTGLWAALVVVIILAALLGLRARSRRDHTRPAPDVAQAERQPAVEPDAPPETGRRPSPGQPDGPAARTAPDETSSREWQEKAAASLHAGQLSEARTQAFAALDRARTEERRRAIEDLLGEIHIRLVFNPYPMEEKVEHVIQRGESLDIVGRRYGATVALLARSNHIRNPNTIHPGQRLRILQGDFRVDVSKRTNEIRVFLNNRFFKRYAVGTGQYEQTPTGTFRITDKIEAPQWYRPDGRVIPYGHPDNELGTHWLSLDIPRYGIHGTWDPDSIGQQSSAGCIRLLNEDVEELYTLLPVGTEVVISE